MQNAAVTVEDLEGIDALDTIDQPTTRREEQRRWMRRGGPLLDFISANFLYILTAVAVVGIAAGAYNSYERNTYSRDMRSIQTSIAAYTSQGKLKNLTWGVLDDYLPPNIEVDSTTGVLYFGGLLGDALPLRIYGGSATAPAPALGAGSDRQLILVAGDKRQSPVNESSGICQDLTRTVGPGVRTIQLRSMAAGNTQTATKTGTDALSGADRCRHKGADGALSADVTWTAGSATEALTFTKRKQDASAAKTETLNTIHENTEIVDACDDDVLLQIVYIIG